MEKEEIQVIQDRVFQRIMQMSESERCIIASKVPDPDDEEYSEILVEEV